jgi:FlaA1/EpsC-like NDP-sugar epimerase
LGNALVKRILKEYPGIKRLVIFSRDEQKQYHMEKKFPESKYPALRYFIGDVRDEKRVNRAMKKIDLLFTLRQ